MKQAICVFLTFSSLVFGTGWEGKPVNTWAPVVWTTPGFPVVPDSSSVLHRRRDGVVVNLASSGFAPNTVVTMWWVIFNRPQFCTHPAPSINALCTGPDLGNAAVAATYQWAGSQVVRDEGEIAIKSSLALGEKSGCASSSLPCAGLLDVNGAEYHIALRSMGPVIPSLLFDQLNTFTGGCLPGQPNAGLCTNVQGAVHPGL
jgi:hypothetical protein